VEWRLNEETGDMMIDTALLVHCLLLGILSFLATDIGFRIWDDRVRRIPLVLFGIEAVARIGRLQPREWRDRVYQRGWMTNAEWRKVNTKHQVLLDQNRR
jgi:hypothetical protein